VKPLICSGYRSGAEGIRTPDLRRAKSESNYRSRSPLFKKCCKIGDLCLGAFVLIRRCSRGLVYYWCKRASTQYQCAFASISHFCIDVRAKNMHDT
jgi:hypothetical protein